MSKSYDNFIWVFDDEKVMKKRVMSIVTDSLWVDDAKNPDTCNVFALIRVFGTEEEVKAIRKKYETPNMWFGYGHAKTALLEILQAYLAPYRAAREELLKHPEIVEAKLAEWARVMNARLDAKMKVVKEVVGVN
jgi:tryptophanyl-tRNA synthetase